MEQVTLTKSVFKNDVNTLSMKALSTKYGLTNTQLKKAMEELGIEKPKVMPRKYVIVDDESLESESMPGLVEGYNPTQYTPDELSANIPQ